MALNGAANAGILATQILGTGDDDLRAHVADLKARLADKVQQAVDDLAARGWRAVLTAPTP